MGRAPRSLKRRVLPPSVRMEIHLWVRVGMVMMEVILRREKGGWQCKGNVKTLKRPSVDKDEAKRGKISFIFLLSLAFFSIFHFDPGVFWWKPTKTTKPLPGWEWADVQVTNYFDLTNSARDKPSTRIFYLQSLDVGCVFLICWCIISATNRKL